MNKKHQRFADEYLIDLNATQAAIRAGYSQKTARQIGQRLLSNVDIKNYISEQLEQIHNKKIADATEVMTYLTSVMRGESSSEIVVVVGCGDGVSEAETVKKSPDEKEKLRAAELLGKTLSMFTDKVNVSGSIPVVITGSDELEE